MIRSWSMAIARWRALLGLLWSAAPWHVAIFALLVLFLGLMPTVVILLTGVLIEASPSAVASGPGSEAGRPALIALGALVASLAGTSVAGHVLTQIGRTLNAWLPLEVHRRVARVVLGQPGRTVLDDPAVADEIGAIDGAERRGVLRQAATRLSAVLIARLNGIGPLVVLLSFRWWAPLALGAAWWLANLVFERATARGLLLDVGDGATRQRRAEYLRSLVLEAPAAKELRLFGLGSWMVDRYAEAWQQALDLMWQRRVAHRGAVAAAIVGLLASHAVVFGALANSAMRGEIAAAALIVFAQAAISTSALGLIGEGQWWLAQALGTAARVRELEAAAGAAELAATASRGRETANACSARQPVEGREEWRSGAGLRPNALVDRPRAVRVRLERVRFSYAHRDRLVLRDVTLDIPPGQSVAIVGENGAGKSTLMALLCGLYAPSAGRLTLDDRPPILARDRIGVIFQDFVRYKLPLRENVGFGHLPLLDDPDALERALVDAGGAGLLGALPHGWDSVLSREFTRGTDLSGGEWQRVALARALLAVRGGAGLLILDEPTASLDVRTETELFERLLALTRGVTTILVSHRLSSVRRVDRILVIEHGRIVEDGRHEDLLRAHGCYAAMFSLQAERFSAAPL